MSSPSQPVNIAKRPIDPVDGIPGSLSTPYGTPDIRLLRAQYAGTPPPPNIPPRNISASPSLRPQVSDVSLIPPNDGQPGSYGGVSAALRATPAPTPRNGSDTPLNLDLDDLPDEEKARVLRRHLVSKEERDAKSTPASEFDVPLGPQPGGSGSRRSSSGAHTPAHVQREDTEPFPIPYAAPGADVT
jgi:proton-coupled amino acid transporter